MTEPKAEKSVVDDEPSLDIKDADIDVEAQGRDLEIDSQAFERSLSLLQSELYLLFVRRETVDFLERTIRESANAERLLSFYTLLTSVLIPLRINGADLGETTFMKTLGMGSEEVVEALAVQMILGVDQVEDELDEGMSEQEIFRSMWRTAVEESAESISAKIGRKKINRRVFLSLVGVGSAAAVGAYANREKILAYLYQLLDLSHLKAADALPSVPKHVDRFVLEQEDMDRILLKYFGVERGTEDDVEYYELSDLVSQNLVPLVNNVRLLSESEELRHPSELVEEALDNYQSVSLELGVPVKQLLRISGISAMNSTEQARENNLYNDVRLRRIQLLMGELLRVNPSVATRMLQAISSVQNEVDIFRGIASAVSPDIPMPPFEVVRMVGPTTSGLDDLESERFARSRATFRKDSLSESERQLLLLRDKIEEQKATLEMSVHKLIARFGSGLRSIFSDRNTSSSRLVLEGIGISSDYVDPWQYVNYTQIWSYLARDGWYIKSNVHVPDLTDDLVLVATSKYCGTDEDRILSIFSEQVLNPRFPGWARELPDFEDSIDRSQFLSLIEIIIQERDQLLKLNREYDCVDAKCSQMEFELEKDEHEQLLCISESSGLLINIVKSHSPEIDLNTDLGLFVVCAIREISPVKSLLKPEGYSFARSTSADLPYAEKIVIDVLLEIVKTIQEFFANYNFYLDSDTIGMILALVERSRNSDIFELLRNRGFWNDSGQFDFRCQDLFYNTVSVQYDRGLRGQYSSLLRAAEIVLKKNGLE